jgi:dihydrofolate reductase
MGRLVVNNAMTVNGAFEAPVPETLQEPLAWNATLLQGDLAESVTALKERHGLLIVSGAGELAHALTSLGLVDEFWCWVSPSLWPAGPRIFDGVGPVRLQLIGSTTFPSGVLRLAYRPAPDQRVSR